RSRRSAPTRRTSTPSTPSTRTSPRSKRPSDGSCADNERSREQRLEMDRVRTNKPKKRGPLYIGLAVVGAAAITLGLSRLKPAPPSIERAATYMDTVRQGTMLREVRGPGTLVPEIIRIIPALTAGRVDEIYARPGTQVQVGTPLIKLSNPDVELQLLESERQLTAAQ